MPHFHKGADDMTLSKLGLALCVIFMILVSFENVKKGVLGGCTIRSKAKFFEKIFSLRWFLLGRSVQKNFKNVDFIL